MAAHRPTYFDYPQTDGPDEPPRGRPGWINTLDDVLRYDPVAGLPVAEPGGGPGVLGTQAQLWTEHLPTADHVLHQAYPRLCGFAEVAWTGGPRDPAEFRTRLTPHLGRLRRLGAIPERDAWWPALAETMDQ
jgi:hexosaminidase